VALLERLGTFLEAVLRSGLQLTGTWPMRTERESRAIGIGTNSLASSIILVVASVLQRATISRRECFGMQTFIPKTPLREMVAAG